MKTIVYLLPVELRCGMDVFLRRGPKGRGLAFSYAGFSRFRFLPRCASLAAPNPTSKLPADKDILNNVIVRDDFLVETSALSCGHRLIDSKRRVI